MFIVVVHNVRSAHNVGSIFRTADGVGLSGIILTGYTPTPARPKSLMMTRAEKMIAKTALGAEKSVPWKSCRTVGAAIKKLRESGFQVIALEQDKKSVVIDSFRRKEQDIALIVGNEVRGIHPSIVRECDAVVDIPMRGKKNSFNVAVAFGIAAFALRSDDYDYNGDKSRLF